VSPGAIVGVELRRIMLDLVTPFRTSFGEQTSRDVLLVAVTVDHDGAVTKGWGECVALSDPHYSPEFVDGAQLVLAEHLVPLARAAPLTAETFRDRVAGVKGHQMAKAALEMALLDAELCHAERSFGEWLGVTRTTVPSGVSVGIFDETARLLAEVADYVAAGYARIKLKIQPGWDLEQVAAVRSLVGADAALQVDANTAYTRDDIGHLCALDEFDLLLIEQPLAEDDLLGHVQLAQASRTPVCLDESIHSLRIALDAIELGACSIVNIKPGRVGGYLEARRIHDACAAREVAVWCGGMVETGIGRAANVALAALPGFTLPGDISGADRFWQRDIVVDPIVMRDGEVTVPSTPGLGFELDMDFVDTITTSTTTA